MTIDSLRSNGLFEARLQELGIQLPSDVAPAAIYESAVESNGFLFVSGQLPRLGSSVAITGSLGSETSLEDGRQGARLCVLRALAVVRQALGTLDRIERVVRLVVYVQSGPDFEQQSDVADAASGVLYEIFGVPGGHARTAVGVYKLPRNAAVEIELTVAVRQNAPTPAAASGQPSV